MANPLLGKWEVVRYDRQPTVTSGPLDSQHTAVHANLIYNPNGEKWKVLYFRSELHDDSNFMETRIWDPTLNLASQITRQRVPNWPTDARRPRLFCSGHAFMHDGRLFLAGGDDRPDPPPPPPPPPPPFKGLPFAYTCDPKIVDDNQKWNYLGFPGVEKPMAGVRWYPTVTVLPNRWLLVMSGYVTSPDPGPPYVPPIFNRLPEIWDPINSVWIRRDHPNAQMPFDAAYPGAHVIPRGQYAGMVFYSMPMQQAYVFNPYFNGIPNGDFYWRPLGIARSVLRNDGCSVLLPLKPSPSTEAKVLILGGNQPDSFLGTYEAVNSAEYIDLGLSTPLWQSVQYGMHFARAHANAVILPDGKVLIIGGNQVYYREGAVTSAELFNPEGLEITNGSPFTLLPPCSYTRMYHSTAILLPNGTVWVAGGDSLSTSSNHIEIYHPGYLFDGDRPSILKLNQTEFAYDETFLIETSHRVDAAILMSLGSTTHAFDQNQRAAYLNVVQQASTFYDLTMPEGPNILPPGYYMLFILRPKADSNSGTSRIPSEARIIRLVIA